MAERKLSIRYSLEGAEETRRQLRELGDDGERALKRIEGAGVPASRSLVAFSSASAEARRSLEGMASTIGPLGTGLTALGAAGTVAGAALAAFTSITIAGAKEWAKYEQSLLRVGGVLKATGDASGLTRTQIADLAEEIEKSTMASAEAALDAAAALASFRSVSGDTFTRATKLAQDMAAVFGGQMSSAAVQLGKALEDPIQGLSALRRVGVTFTSDQEDMVKAMVKAGDQARAQTFILNELEKQIGGAGAAERGGLSGSVKGLSDSWSDLLKEIGRTSPVVAGARTAMDYVAGWINSLTESKSSGAQLKEALAELERLGPVMRGLAGDPTNTANIGFGGRYAELLKIIEALERAKMIEEDRQEIAKDSAAAAAAEREVERQKSRAKALGEFVTEQDRELRLAKMLNAEREIAVAREKARVDLLKAVPDAGDKEISDAQARAEAAAREKLDREALRKTIEEEGKELDRLSKKRDEQKKQNVEISEQIQKQVREIDGEREAYKLSDRERTVALEVLKAEETARKRVSETTGEIIALTDDERRAVQAAAGARFDSKASYDAARKAAEDYAKQIERIVDRTADRLVDFGADSLFDALNGKSTDFWKTFEEQGKRALAQLAAEALIRPIVLPIIQSVVGSAPGLFGVQGNPLGGFAQGAAQSAGSSLFGGGNPISSLLNGVQQMFSPNNFIANAFPSIFGSGLTGGAAIAAGLTGPGGLALGGGVTSSLAVGTTAGPLAAMAPFLPMLAIALPLLLSFFMGGKKSVGPNGNAIINFERDAEGRLTNPGGLAIGGLGADNGGDREYARKMAEGATKAVNTIVDRIGGRMTGMPGAGQSGQLELGYFQEGNVFFSIVGGTKAEFGSAEEAVADFAKRTLQAAEITGLSPDVALALSKTMAASLEELGEDVDFAFGFRRQVDMAAAGPGTRQAQALGFQYAAEDSALAQRLALRDFVADARRLFGEDSTQYGEAQTTARNRALNLIGLGPDADAEGNEPLEGVAAVIAQTRANFQALKATLIDTGLTAEEAQAKIDQGLVRTFGKLADEAEKNIADALLASESPAAAQAKALAEAQAKRRADLVDVQTAAGRTVDTSTLDRLSASERGKFLDGLDLKGLADVVRNLSTITEDVGEAMTLLFESRSRAAKQLDTAVLQAESPAAAQAKALAEAQAKRRTDANVLGLDSGKLDRLDRLEAGAALIGLTAAQLDEVAAAMGGVGQMTAPMRAALEQAQAFAGFVASFGQMQVDIARWAYEAQQASETIAEAEQAATDAKQVYIDALNAEISTVGEAIQVQEQLKAGYERVAETLKKTRLGLLIDPNLSPLSPAERLAEANRQFAETYAKAQGGDLGAAEDLSDIGRALLEAERAYSASSPAYVATFERVQAALANTESIAEREARIAGEQLTVLEAQQDTLRETLAELQEQSGDIRTVAEAAELYRRAQEELEAIRDAIPVPGVRGEEQYQAFRGLASNFVALSAGAASQAERDAIYQATAPQRDALLGAITDIATLQRIGADYYQGNTTDSGAIFLRSRLYSLGAVPGFAEGGVVDQPTMAWIAERGQAEAVVPLSRGRSIPVEIRRDREAPTNDNAPVVRAIGNLSSQLSRDNQLLRQQVAGLQDSHDRLSSRLKELEARRDPNPLGRTGTR